MVRTHARRVSTVAAVLVMAGGGLAVASPTSTAKVKLVITDTSGAPVTRAAVGQVLRLAAVPKVGRVCVEGNVSGICAPPQRPHVLVRRVNGNLVVNGRVRGSVVDFSRTLATRSIPVSPLPASAS